MNLLFSYTSEQNDECHAEGCEWLGVGSDENGKEVNVFLKRDDDLPEGRVVLNGDWLERCIRRANVQKHERDKVYKGNEQLFTAHGGWVVGYYAGKVAVLEMIAEACGVDIDEEGK